VVKIRKDSIADSIGRLQVDDEIVKWNGKLLRGLTYDEVYSIVSNSQQDFSQIDLVVERIVE
jgi:regulating synaptic membrane exocytosis protein 2